MDGKKTYVFEVTWGKETSTDDKEGDVLFQSDKRPSQEEIECLLPQFHGVVMQIPPVYSALKVNGKRAYDLARKGENIELKARPVQIDSLKILSHESDKTVFEVVCGKGTYVRSIGHDLGRLCGCYGFVSSLRRTKCGPFDVNCSILLENLEKKELVPSMETLVFEIKSNIDNYKHLMTIANVGVRYKGFQFVIQALGIIKKKTGKCNYIYNIVGEGDQTYLKKQAENMDIQEDNILLIDNGEKVTFKDGKRVPGFEEIPVDGIMIDGIGVGDVGTKVIDDRILLSQDGVVIIGMTVDQATREIITATDVQTRGFVYLRDADYIVKAIIEMAEMEVEKAHENRNIDLNDTRSSIKDKVMKYILKETGKKPVVLPVIIEIPSL